MKKSAVRLMASIPVFLGSGCMHTMGGWDHMRGYGGYGGFFMWILLILAAAVIFYLIFSRTIKTDAYRKMETHMDILKKRYARGEITREEFERMKRELEE